MSKTKYSYYLSQAWKNVKMSNAYCKKHDEIEPENSTEFWACPKCSKENLKNRNLDKTLTEIKKQLGGQNE